jgi:hypothetical protein
MLQLLLIPISHPAQRCSIPLQLNQLAQFFAGVPSPSVTFAHGKIQFTYVLNTPFLLTQHDRYCLDSPGEVSVDVLEDSTFISLQIAEVLISFLFLIHNQLSVMLNE